MAKATEAPEDSGITYDDDGQPTGGAGDLARYHANRGEFAEAIRALADKVDPHKEARATRGGE